MQDIFDKDGKPIQEGPAPLVQWEKAAARVHNIALHKVVENDVGLVFVSYPPYSVLANQFYCKNKPQ